MQDKYHQLYAVSPKVRDPSEESPLVVVVHGYGANGYDQSPTAAMEVCR